MNIREELLKVAFFLSENEITQEQMKEICPKCATKMEDLNCKSIKLSAWENLPKGWTQESLEKFWKSLTGKSKHKVTACIDKMKDKIDDAGAFCASLCDKIEGTEWRHKKRSHITRTYYKQGNIIEWIFDDSIKQDNVKNIINKELKAITSNKYACDIVVNKEFAIKLDNIDERKLKLFGFEIKG